VPLFHILCIPIVKCSIAVCQFEKGEVAPRIYGQSIYPVSMEVDEQQENGDIEVAWLVK